MGMICLKLTKTDVVLFSGDSITDGNRGHKMDCNHIMGHGYAEIVAASLALENAESMPKFINKGYSGATMEKLLSTWDEDILRNKPTVLSILAGVNDCMFGSNNGISPEEVAKNYSVNLCKAIERTIAALGDVRIILCEPFYFPLDRSDLTYRFTPHPECEPEFLRPDRFDTKESDAHRLSSMELIQAELRTIADETGSTFVPLRKKFEDAISKSKREYFIWDGTHPSIAGHALIAKQWLSVNK